MTPCPTGCMICHACKQTCACPPFPSQALVLVMNAESATAEDLGVCLAGYDPEGEATQ